MYTIEIFDTDWTQASSHTQSIDRDTQYQRFLDQGILAETLRFTEN